MIQIRIAFAPKYRRQIIYGKIKQDIGQMIRKLCEYKGVEIIEAEACKDHIHMLVSLPPKYSVILSRLVDTFSSRILYPMLPLSGNHSIAVV